ACRGARRPRRDDLTDRLLPPHAPRRPGGGAEVVHPDAVRRRGARRDGGAEGAGGAQPRHALTTRSRSWLQCALRVGHEFEETLCPAKALSATIRDGTSTLRSCGSIEPTAACWKDCQLKG